MAKSIAKRLVWQKRSIWNTQKTISPTKSSGVLTLPHGNLDCEGSKKGEEMLGKPGLDVDNSLHALSERKVFLKRDIAKLETLSKEVSPFQSPGSFQRWNAAWAPDRLLNQFVNNVYSKPFRFRVMEAHKLIKNWKTADEIRRRTDFQRR